MKPTKQKKSWTLWIWPVNEPWRAPYITWETATNSEAAAELAAEEWAKFRKNNYDDSSFLQGEQAVICAAFKQGEICLQANIRYRVFRTKDGITTVIPEDDKTGMINA